MDILSSADVGPLLLAGLSLASFVTAFIGVFIDHPKAITQFERAIDKVEAVQECHHVTGQHTFLLKVKADNTSSLEELISKIRSIEGVARTETSVVLSTYTEGLWLDLKAPGEAEDGEGERGHKGK